MWHLRRLLPSSIMETTKSQSQTNSELWTQEAQLVYLLETSKSQEDQTQTAGDAEFTFTHIFKYPKIQQSFQRLGTATQSFEESN